MFLFETPIKMGKVRKGINWYQYRNGMIEISGEKFLFYSIRDAVKKWRTSHKKK